MALIECTECGQRVSDAAEACPGCGHPVGGWTGATVDAGARKTCPKCAESIPAAAQVCRHCGHDFERAARGGCGPAILSLLIPGLGQLARGQVLAGVIYFLVAVALWTIFLGWAVNIVSAVAAYSGEG